MMTITLHNGATYRVRFRHINTLVEKNAKKARYDIDQEVYKYLGPIPNIPCTAITTCTIEALLTLPKAVVGVQDIEHTVYLNDAQYPELKVNHIVGENKHNPNNVDVWAELAHEVAFCSVYDNFCKKTGRKVALTKALNHFPGPEHKDFRVAVWDAYWERNHEKNHDRKPMWGDSFRAIYRKHISTDSAWALMTIHA